MKDRSLPELGELERRVLARLWSDGPADVKGMHRAVGEPRGIKPNTIHSTLERLCRKQLVARAKQGRAYRYEARITRREWVARSLQDLLGRLPGEDAGAGSSADAGLLIASFVDLAERTGAAQLEALERRVRARRRKPRAHADGEGT